MNKLLASVLLALPAIAGAQVRTITVTGSGSVPVVPDVANVSYQFIDTLSVSKTGVTLDPSVAAQGAAPALTAPRKKTSKAEQASLPQMVEQNKQRVTPAVAYIKSVVAEKGTVEVLPSVERVTEWDQQGRKQVLTGYRIVTNIQVKLEGREAIEQKLAGLFDSAKIKADEMSEPTMGLTPATQKTAQLQAYKAAVTDGVETAQAQLEQGEQLGAALERGERVNVAAPRYAKARMAAASMESAGGGADDIGQAAVETGKITVGAIIHFVFEVTGTPVRLGAAAAGR